MDESDWRRPQVFYAMQKFDRLLHQVERTLIIGICSLMLIIVTTEVFYRYVLNKTLMVGIQEIAKWSFVWLSAMGCSALVYKKGHVAVEYFMNRFLNQRQQKVIDIIFLTFLLVFVAATIWTGFPFAIGQWYRFSTSAEIPTTVVYLCIPISFCFMLVHVFAQLMMSARELRKGKAR